jgi:glycosyltransferase involved in cell wall biosynthesis
VPNTLVPWESSRASPAPMGSPPLLTIAIPTLNRAYCLSRAIESALAQTVMDIEILVSDNGSTDETRSLLDRYNDPRLRKFQRGETISATAHGNFLIEQSKGRYFLGLSDDDYLEPYFAERVLDLFSRHPELSFVYTGCWIHYADIAVPTLIGRRSKTVSILSLLTTGMSVTFAVCLCDPPRTSENDRPIPEGVLFGDMYYWTKIAFFGPVGCVRELLSNYVFMMDNMSSAAPVPQWAAEAESLANEACQRYFLVESSVIKRLSMRRNVARYLAVSIGNQFAWNAVRQRSRLQLIAWLAKTLRYFVAIPGALTQVMAALILPRKVLRNLILCHARRLRTCRLSDVSTACNGGTH